jgi:2-polyprenyl-3-methyl-5-hydroxy-6-metoxy-1,4-benzoquinol methylase
MSDSAPGFSSGTTEHTREPQYQRCLELRDRYGLTHLGLMSNQVWHDDPRRLGIILARYKFVAKMLSGRGNVLEVGCADAFGTRVVQQEVDRVTAVDFDPLFVESALATMAEDWPFTCRVHDILSGPVEGPFDGAYSVDVLEHIPVEDEDRFVANVAASLLPDGVFIAGTPSLESQTYASPGSQEGHVNCKTAEDLRALMLRYFKNVFIFSMNDEVVHTGYYRMAHYLLALCCGTRL